MRVTGSVAGRKLESVRRLLQTLRFPERFLTSQTAVCLVALSDGRKRGGLLAGKQTLAEGARVHDILEFARGDLGIRVAENTRESYRKTSLKPLYEAGLITRHQLSTNDPIRFTDCIRISIQPLQHLRFLWIKQPWTV